jgi:hypothetical protein
VPLSPSKQRSPLPAPGWALLGCKSSNGGGLVSDAARQFRDTVGPVNARDRREAVRLLERLLDEVDAGHLSADGAIDLALVRRMEGAVLALRATDAGLVGPRNEART